LRPAIVARLVDVRGSLDHAIARVSAEDARALFEAVMHAMSTLLVTGDHALHRGFVHSFIAVRAADGLGPDHAQRLLVAITDVAAAVARDRYPQDLTVVLAIHHAARLTARMVNDGIAEELATRLAQLPPTTGARR
jgi:hypothetical protein